MTQFVLVGGDHSGISTPDGIRALPINENTYLLQAAAALFSNITHDRIRFVCDGSSETADALLDRIHFLILSGLKIEDDPFICYLRRAITGGMTVVCWYSDWWEDLDSAEGWADFLKLLIRDATEQPPELYLRTVS